MTTRPAFRPTTEIVKPQFTVKISGFKVSEATKIHKIVLHLEADGFMAAVTAAQRICTLLEIPMENIEGVHQQTT